MIDQDISIGVMDSEKIIVSQNGDRIKTKIKPGDPNKYGEFVFTPVIDDNGASTDIVKVL